MAESLQPAGNVPRLFIWQKHLAQVQQHEQQKQQQNNNTLTMMKSCNALLYFHFVTRQLA
jgi:hypothetical protein